MKVFIKNVRLSFPDLFIPRPFKPGDEPKYKATLLLAKDDPQIAAIETAIKEAAKASKWGAKADSVLKSIRGNPNKFCFQDGDTKDYDGYAGMMALTANSKSRPLVIDGQKNPLTQADGKPYAGYYVNASVEFFGYDNSGSGISASLKGVQFVRDGDSFSGSTPASPDDFESINEGAEAPDMDQV